MYNTYSAEGDKGDKFDQSPRNPAGLRVVKTARTEEAINAAVKEGLRPLVKAVVPSKDIHDMFAVYQHRVTGEIVVSGDVRWPPSRKEYERVVQYSLYYQYRFPTPFAAYLLPPDLAEGERVWLDDIIEDIVAVYGNQNNNLRLKAYEATWVGGDFKVNFDPEKDAHTWIG